jgi:ParB family transcriptional regulator, chromosome partitioning protein
VDRDFIASIRDHGVLVPVIAVRTSEHQIRVRFGHRRVLAAIQAGLPSVPVLVVANEGGDDAAQVERLVTQYAENQHRTGLSTAEQVGVAAPTRSFRCHPAADRPEDPDAAEARC